MTAAEKYAMLDLTDRIKLHIDQALEHLANQRQKENLHAALDRLKELRGIALDD